MSQYSLNLVATFPVLVGTKNPLWGQLDPPHIMPKKAIAIAITTAIALDPSVGGGAMNRTANQPPMAGLNLSCRRLQRFSFETKAVPAGGRHARSPV